MSTSSLLVIAVVIGLFIVIGFGVALSLLFRNREGAKSSSATGLPALRTRANVALVHLDESLASADNELGFAIAQFGEQKTAEFALAVEKSRQMATTAFRLRRELDDAFPESITKQREMTLQMIALGEGAQQLLDAQQGSFSILRIEELKAPQSLRALADGITAAETRLPAAETTLARLAAEYRPTIAAEHEQALAETREQLASARATVAAAEQQLSPAGVNAVTGDVQKASQSLARANALLDSIDATAKQLDAAAAAVATLVASTRADLTEARTERDSAPDADTGEAIVDAIDRLEKVLASVAAQKKPSDPIQSLDNLNAAITELDTALATARNQSQRLEHARLALAGTLVSARSQLTATKGFIAAGGRHVGSGARARLSEAERELANAEVEADPVAALDAARRAVTNARDADALARYDAMN